MENRQGREGKNLNILTNYASKITISEFANFAHSLSAALRQTPLFLFGAPWNSQTSPCTLLATLSKHRGMRTSINHVASNTKCWKSPGDLILYWCILNDSGCHVYRTLILTVQSDSSDCVHRRFAWSQISRTDDSSSDYFARSEATEGGTISAIWLTNVITLGFSLFQSTHHPIDLNRFDTAFSAKTAMIEPEMKTRLNSKIYLHMK